MLETEVLMDGCSYGWLTDGLDCLAGLLAHWLVNRWAAKDQRARAMRFVPSRHSTFVIVMELYSTKHVSSTDS